MRSAMPVETPGTVDALARRIAALESELRVVTAAFETAEGMLVTDAHGIILRVNQGFSRITGYTAMEAVGQRPAMLSSGKHDADFYRKMWDAIHRDDRWDCLLYTSPSPRDRQKSRMPSSA